MVVMLLLLLVVVVLLQRHLLGPQSRDQPFFDARAVDAGKEGRDGRQEGVCANENFQHLRFAKTIGGVWRATGGGVTRALVAKRE